MLWAFKWNISDCFDVFDVIYFRKSEENIRLINQKSKTVLISVWQSGWLYDCSAERSPNHTVRGLF